MDQPSRATDNLPERRALDPFESTVGLLGILRILFRWSFVVAPLIALTIWLALSQTEDIQPEFKAEASLLLLGPNEILTEDSDTGELDITTVNPLQQLGGTLNTVARVTVLAMSDAVVSEQLLSEGLTNAYAIGAESQVPILRLEVVDPDAELAEATLDRLIAMVFDDLKSRQDILGAPESNRVGAQLISAGIADGPDFSARTRVRIAIAAIGFAVSVAMAFLLEGLSELWHRRKRTEARPLIRSLPSGEPSADRLVTVRAVSSEFLVESERESLVGVLHMITANVQLSEEIATRACESAIEDWDAIEHREPVEWLYGFAIREAWAEQPNIIDADATDDALWTSLTEMSQERRAVLALASVAELTDPHIAAVLNSTVATVRTHRDAGASALSQITDGPLTDDGPLSPRKPRSTSTAKKTANQSRPGKRRNRANATSSTKNNANATSSTKNNTNATSSTKNNTSSTKNNTSSTKNNTKKSSAANKRNRTTNSAPSEDIQGSRDGVADEHAP